MSTDNATFDQGHRDSIGQPVQVELLHVPDCPLLDRVRVILRTSLTKTTVRVTIDEREGPYPSPTLLIEGHDVTGRVATPGPSCRLDLPTEEQILAALSSTRPGAKEDAVVT